MTEIEELREEIKRLREEITLLRAGRQEYHYHYHGPAPVLPSPYPPNPYPWTPGQPYYPVVGGAADPNWYHLTGGFGTPTC